MRWIATILFSAATIFCYGQDTTALELIFVGDIMQHESQMKAAIDSKTNTYNYSGLFEKVAPTLRAADLAIGNLEFTFGGKPYTGYPAFSAPDELLGAIKDAGFDVLVTANNHSADRGRSGIERTIRLLDSASVVHTGTFSDTVDYLNDYPLMVDKNGFRLAILNYTYGTNGIVVRAPNVVNMIDTARIRVDIGKARLMQPDLIIVIFHWGEEYEQQPSASQQQIASFTLAQGAQLIIGSHPHVLQPMSWDREKNQAVVYSLGNFVSGQRVRYRNGGAMVHVQLQRSRMGKEPGRTWISDVSYSLVWVNRAGPKRKFELIPIDAPADTAVVQGATSRALMMEFVNDSRTFLDKENLGVQERARAKKSN